jgi:hypothetical protein
MLQNCKFRICTFKIKLVLLILSATTRFRVITLEVYGEDIIKMLAEIGNLQHLVHKLTSSMVASGKYHEDDCVAASM